MRWQKRLQPPRGPQPAVLLLGRCQCYARVVERERWFADASDGILAQVAEVRERLSDREKLGKKMLFQEHLSRLRKALRKALGPAAGPYLPVTSGSRPETRVDFALGADRIQFDL